MIYSSRLSRLRAEMYATQIDFLLLTPSTDLFYLTGMRGKPYPR
ncbi:MAG: aminopeptidase P family N-terminal domain-containing protein [Lachnospiraceae bacterium]|nr:aminopeptidase P family N-terminal domain-containing protein [Lachnospiraceae bacterium]